MSQNPVRLAVITLIVFLLLSSLLGVNLSVLINDSMPIILVVGGALAVIIYLKAQGFFYKYNALEEGVAEEKKTALTNLDKYHKFMPVYVKARKLGLLVGYTKGSKRKAGLTGNDMLLVGIPFLNFAPFDKIRINEYLICVPSGLINDKDGVMRINSSIIKKGYYWYALDDDNMTTNKVIAKNEDLCTWKILEQRYKEVGTAMSSHIDSDKLHKERLQEKANVEPVSSDTNA